MNADTMDMVHFVNNLRELFPAICKPIDANKIGFLGLLIKSTSEPITTIFSTA